MVGWDRDGKFIGASGNDFIHIRYASAATADSMAAYRVESGAGDRLKAHIAANAENNRKERLQKSLGTQVASAQQQQQVSPLVQMMNLAGGIDFSKLFGDKNKPIDPAAGQRINTLT